MSEERKDFLSRWSQRKLEVRQQEASPPVPAPEIEPPAQEIPDPTAVTPEEIAALPKVEELTAETDITAFLRKGVPEWMRNAALRRMWSLDPAIRDYVSEAREYAYDWNVPGSVPGNGPLLPGDNVEEMLKGIFGDGPPEELVAEAEQAVRGALSQGREARTQPEAEAPGDDGDRHAALQQEEASVEAPGQAEAPEGQALPAPAAEPVASLEIAAVPLPPAPEPLPVARPARHGGAKPV